MDPQATYDELEDQLDQLSELLDDLRVNCRNLRDWLRAGGFEPSHDTTQLAAYARQLGIDARSDDSLRSLCDLIQGTIKGRKDRAREQIG